MIKENKLKYIISSIIIILPFIVSMFIQGSVDDMMKGAWYFAWIMPLALFGLHTALLIITRRIDNIKQSAKIENLIFFMVPAISLYVGAIFIAIMLGLEFNIGMVIGVVMGISFIVMGNYMPKAKRNATFGMKIKWTLANDDNWAATHRLSGKVMVIAGIASFAISFLPMIAFFIAFTVIIVTMVTIPIVYSYWFYKNQIKTGAATEDDYKNGITLSKKATASIIAIVAVSLIIVILMIFTGGLQFELGDDALTVKPTLGGGIELNYSELVDADIEYRDAKVPGTRVMGYGSAKLLYGQFRNDEFGNYTRYTYTDSEASIIIRTESGILVLADETTEKTQAIYTELLAKIAACK
jgi:uncharacterized membrane protein